MTSTIAKPGFFKTTLNLPKGLHRAMKIRSVIEERHLQDIAADAFREYLAKARSAKRDRS